MSSTVFFILVVVLFLLVGEAFSGTAPLTLFTPAEVQKNNARCLDGSPAGYYLYKTSNSAYVNKWVFYLEGGGWCFPNSAYPNVQDCYQRIGGGLGSSKYWPTSVGVGFFRDYNYVYLQYCSGDFHSGTQTTAAGGLYYAGHLILEAVVAKLKAEQNLAAANQIVLTGESAGGLGVIVNMDWMRAQFPNADFRAWPASGWFPSAIPIPANYVSLEKAMQILHAQVKPWLNQACVANFTSEPWLCYAGHLVYPFAVGSIKMLVSQAIFDNWAQGFNGVPDINSPAGIAYMTHFGQLMRNTFFDALRGPETVALFLTEQNVHTFGLGTTINGVSLQTIASNWLDGTGNVKQVSNCTYLNCAAVPYQGCFVDNQQRDLPAQGPQIPQQTVEACQTYCRSKSFKYAGIQDGNECYCGNSYGKFGSEPSGCRTLCSGNANEFCGDVWRNSVYTA